MFLLFCAWFSSLGPLFFLRIQHLGTSILIFSLSISKYDTIERLFRVLFCSFVSFVLSACHSEAIQMSSLSLSLTGFDFFFFHFLLFLITFYLPASFIVLDQTSAVLHYTLQYSTMLSSSEMNPQSDLTEYLLSLLKIQMTDPEPYLFDKDCLVLPAHLKEVLPPNVVQGFVNARWAASKALRYIRAVERNYHKRYNAMCPLGQHDRVLAHIESVGRLVAWKADKNETNPTLAPTAKIDPSTLTFYIDHRTYDDFAWNYVQLLERFLQGPYKKWLEAKKEVERSVDNANLSETDYGHWYRFWNLTFLVEMNKWEGHLQGLLLPSWEEMVDSLRHLILEFVESPDVVLSDLYRSSGIMMQ